MIAINLSPGDLEYIAQGLAILTDLRMTQGLEVGSVVYNGHEFILEWDEDATGYYLRHLND